jgi:hypothetical protein
VARIKADPAASAAGRKDHVAITGQTFYTATIEIETTYTAARDQLKGLMDRVVADREMVMVGRRQGGDVALVATEELEGLLETALFSPHRDSS